MLPAGLETAKDVKQHYDDIYFDLIASGRAQRYLAPRVLIGVSSILAYLLLDHRGSRLRSSTRYIAFILLCIYETWEITSVRARNPATSFGGGLVSVFSLLWVATHMIVNDCQTDYRRIERRSGQAVLDSQDQVSTKSSQNGSTFRSEGQANGPAGGTKPTLYWQSYPSSLIDRVDWITDVFISFRGVGWNWQTSVPDAPAWFTAQLDGKQVTPQVDEVTISRTGIRRFSSRSKLLQDTIPAILLGYLAIDALKTYTLHDPYFWGYTDGAAPAFWPQIVQDSYFLTKLARLLLTTAFTCITLGTIFKLGPVFFAGVLGPRWIGLRGEALMNPPDMFGPFTNVLDKGLAGWWGGFWHQVFRAAFEAPAIRLLQVLNIDKRSTLGKMLSLATAFFLSGCLHAVGSYTQLGDTRPIRGPMLFFLLQGLGIALETLGWDALRSAGVKLPGSLKRVANFGFAFFWLCQTGPLLSDDFSQGGVWLFEPVPFSVFRGLGLGPAGTGWWCWGSDFASWHNGKTWWDTGLLL